jgi:hypothetical protein
MDLYESIHLTTEPIKMNFYIEIDEALEMNIGKLRKYNSTKEVKNAKIEIL